MLFNHIMISQLILRLWEPRADNGYRPTQFNLTNKLLKLKMRSYIKYPMIFEGKLEMVMDWYNGTWRANWYEFTCLAFDRPQLTYFEFYKYSHTVTVSFKVNELKDSNLQPSTHIFIYHLSNTQIYSVNWLELQWRLTVALHWSYILVQVWVT